MNPDYLFSLIEDVLWIKFCVFFRLNSTNFFAILLFENYQVNYTTIVSSLDFPYEWWVLKIKRFDFHALFILDL